MNKIRQIVLLCVTIFAGSVFLTSGKFVNATNTPKLYFVVISLLITAVIIAISRKRLNFHALKSKTMLWGMNIICFLQACYGLFQFIGWFPSNHSKFPITGSFENPAGFAAVLSFGYPVGMFLLTKGKKNERFLASLCLFGITIAIFLSGSRAGVLAILLSSVAFLLIKTNIIIKFQQLKYNKLLSVMILCLFMGGAFILYYQKNDSANGRLLIWEVSSEMIKAKPLFGHGYDSFQANYMDYQAEYFKRNTNSRFELLADNVKHPFNEFIKVAVEIGLVGLTIVLSTFLFAFWIMIKSTNENKELFLSGFLSFLVFASFSYPLHYVAVWLLLAFYFFVIVPFKEIKINNTPVTIFIRSMIVIACTFFLFHIYRQIQAEIKWKTIAISSLSGNTNKMLPEYEKLYLTPLKRNPYFLYNYGAELNFAGKLDKSIAILAECEKRFNDYDLQMLMADNYYSNGNPGKAIKIYQHASNMIPCRFIPIYRLFEIHRKAGKKDMAVKYANEIVTKKIKIPSITVTFIKSEAVEYIKENESTFGVCAPANCRSQVFCVFHK